MKKKISIIGCGAIGSELAQHVDSNMGGNVTLVSLFDIRLENAQSVKSKLIQNSPLVFNNFNEFIKSESFEDVELIVEAASQNAITTYLNQLILFKKDVLVMSVGAFANSDFFSEVIK